MGPHPLDDPHPGFLDLLEAEPERALAEFAEFAYRLLSARPPRVLGALSAARREDAIQEVLLGIVSRPDALRRYTPRPGVPFAAWFQVVAHNRVVDWLRGESRPTLGEAVEPEVIDRLASTTRPASSIAARLRRCMRELSPKCQVLVEMHLMGYDAMDMARLLPTALKLVDYSNRQASDDLRYCKHCLRELALSAGLGPGRDWFGDGE